MSFLLRLFTPLDEEFPPWQIQGDGVPCNLMSTQEYFKEYYQKNRKHLNKYQRERYAQKSEVREYHEKYRGEHREMHREASKRCEMRPGMKEKRKEFRINHRKKLLDILGDRCWVCGSVKNLQFHEMRGKEHSKSPWNIRKNLRSLRLVPLCGMHHRNLHFFFVMLRTFPFKTLYLFLRLLFKL